MAGRKVINQPEAFTQTSMEIIMQDMHIINNAGLLLNAHLICLRIGDERFFTLRPVFELISEIHVGCPHGSFSTITSGTVPSRS